MLKEMFYSNAGCSLQNQKALLSKDFPAWKRDLSSVPPRASAASQNVPSHRSKRGACPPTETKARPGLTSRRCAGGTAGLQHPLFTKPFLNWGNFCFIHARVLGQSQTNTSLNSPSPFGVGVPGTHRWGPHICLCCGLVTRCSSVTNGFCSVEIIPLW